MSATKKTKKPTTIYLEDRFHKALKIKAAMSDSSISSFVNEAVESLLLEEKEDLLAFKKRKNEPSIEFESFVKTLNEK